ncbi:hypothetical protein QE152_g27464 [Popillia japonica]|uniref:DUF4371 domain-containing protein n=1 Tax=Popillia japonica TaxID=7064 RepID=A0AAW1JVI5_POPJA
MCAILFIYCYCDTSSIFHIIIEMKRNFLVSIMAIIVFLAVRTQTTSKSKFAPDHMFQVCGKHLSSLLALVCESKYNTPSICMFCQDRKEELLGLLPLSGQTRGEDIANAVEKCLEDNKIDLHKIVSKATDGARSMTGKNIEKQRFFRAN